MAKEKIEEEEKKKKLKSKHKLNKMSDKLISAQFSEGYAFRGLISLLKQIIPSANLIFTKKGISIKRSDNSEQILILVEIDANEIDYHYNVMENGTEAKELVVQVSIPELEIQINELKNYNF